MDIICRICGGDFLYFDSEFVRPECHHLLHRHCLTDNNNFCYPCGRVLDDGEDVQTVKWDELSKLIDDCNDLQWFLADHVGKIAKLDRSDPIAWMHGVTTAVTRVAYPSILIQRMAKGLDSYKKGTESLYHRDGESGLVNFGIPVRFNNETSKSIKAVRRCIQELNRWMELELTRSKDINIEGWEDVLQLILPNLKIPSKNQSLKLYKKPSKPSYCWKIK